MKKFISALMILTMAFSFVACSAKELDEEIVIDATAQPTAEPTTEPTTEPTSEPTQEPASEPISTTTNPLTGEDTLSEEAVGTRPVAIMINNATANLPQYGIAAADIIFEVTVEANMTRMLGIYADYTAIPSICSVRSARYYFPYLSESFNAIYVHWGREGTYADAAINDLDMDNLDGMTSNALLFGRDQDKLDSGYALEHTSVFYGENLADYLIDQNYDLEIDEEYEGMYFNFNSESTPADGEEMTEFTFDFGNYYSTFTYNSEEKVYYKDHNGSPQIDSSTGEQLSFTNLIVMETEVGSLYNSYLTVDVIGENEPGYYFSNGTMQEITWTKLDETAQITFYDLDGNEISINTGKTYIGIGEISVEVNS